MTHKNIQSLLDTQRLLLLDEDVYKRQDVTRELEKRHVIDHKVKQARMQ